MTKSEVLTVLWTGVFLLVHLAVIARVILRPHREPASRIAWIVVIIVFPVIGILTYIFLGETSIGRRRVSRMCAVLATMPDLTRVPGMDAPNLQPKIPETYAHLFRLGHSVNGFEPVGGNCATLLADSNTAVESMVQAPRLDPNCFLFYLLAPRSRSCSSQTWMLRVTASFASAHKTLTVSRHLWAWIVRNNSNPAEQNERDYKALLKAIRDGRIQTLEE